VKRVKWEEVVKAAEAQAVSWVDEQEAREWAARKAALPKGHIMLPMLDDERERRRAKLIEQRVAELLAEAVRPEGKEGAD